MEAPKIVFTIAKATTPPSAPVDYEVMMLMRLFMYSITVLFHRVPLIARSWDLGSEEVETQGGNGRKWESERERE